ncbi:MAG: SDR family oxidoreductase [Pedosphaera sp.]|nr:SDR family oxidoreductase [Pedosphaera sp.]
MSRQGTETALGPVWITGAGGLIGHALVQLSSERSATDLGTISGGQGCSIRALTRGIVDLTNFAAVDRLFTEEQPVGVIHCAAISKSPACQKDPANARLNNVEVTRHLAALADSIPFLFLSTDLVFDGLRGGYLESDPVNPLSVYAETKAEAEQIILANKRHTVIRTSLNCGKSPLGCSAFNEEMRNAWQLGRTLDLFVDEFRTPIPALETARNIWKLLTAGQTGLFHLAGAERLSRYEIGLKVADVCRKQNPRLMTSLRPGSLAQYQGAPRAPDTCLDCRRIEETLGIKMPLFSTWIIEQMSQAG